MLRTFETTFWILSTSRTRAQGYRSVGQRGVFMGFGSFPFHSVFQALPPYPGSITSSSSCASDTSTTSSFACSGTLTSSCIIPMSTVTAIHKNMTTAYWTLYQSGQSAAMLISTQSAAETKRQAGHLLFPTRLRIQQYILCWKEHAQAVPQTSASNNPLSGRDPGASGHMWPLESLHRLKACLCFRFEAER